MTERAAHLVDAVLPWVPVRQWVLTMPYRLLWVSAHHRPGLERLARSILRPPFAQERLRLRNDGRVALELKPTPRAWTWAALMHRAFAIDVLACPHCGSRLRLIATLHDPAVIRKLLAHLGMAASGPSPGPAPPESNAAA